MYYIQHIQHGGGPPVEAALTCEAEAEGGGFEQEEDLLAEGHADADGSHQHQEEAGHSQHGRRHVQLCEEEEEEAEFSHRANR